MCFINTAVTVFILAITLNSFTDFLSVYDHGLLASVPTTATCVRHSEPQSPHGVSTWRREEMLPSSGVRTDPTRRVRRGATAALPHPRAGGRRPVPEVSDSKVKGKAVEAHTWGKALPGGLCRQGPGELVAGGSSDA